jgi:hypothetical protein
VTEIFEEKAELNRIFVCSILACLLFLFSAFLDGPVTIPGWALFAVGFLCLVYIAVAARSLLSQKRSHQPKAEQND